MTTPSTEQAQLAEARRLIENKQYAEAQKLLSKIDSPTARKWEARLAERRPSLTQSPAKKRFVPTWFLIFLCLAVIAIGGAAVYELNQSGKDAGLQEKLFLNCQDAEIDKTMGEGTLTPDDNAISTSCNNWAIFQMKEDKDTISYCQDQADQQHRDATFDECLKDRSITPP